MEDIKHADSGNEGVFRLIADVGNKSFHVVLTELTTLIGVDLESMRPEDRRQYLLYASGKIVPNTGAVLDLADKLGLGDDDTNILKEIAQRSRAEKRAVKRPPRRGQY
jgi:hypothetical protein